MNSSAYREEELVDALVIDREGYICGRVANFSVEKDRIVINLYKHDMKKIEAPNERELIKRLLGVMPQRGLLRRGLEKEKLYDMIREALHLPKREPVTLERLIEYAKTKRIEIPYETQEVKVKAEIGSVDWSYVDKVAFTELGNCLLLKEALEAKNKGISLSNEVAYKSTENLAGRLILDSKAKIVGSAAKFLIGDPPGMLINVERSIKMEQMDSESLKKSLVPSKFKDFKELSEAVKKGLGLKAVTDDDLFLWAKRNEINIPMKVVERREVEMELPVDWNKVDKIGDVVILKEPLELLVKAFTPPMPVNEPQKANDRPLASK